MIHQSLVGTDAAQLAFWDVQHTRPGAESMALPDLDEMWKNDAWGGRVFFINTGADGAWDIHFYVDEPVSENLLLFYKTLNRRFLLRCPTGRLIADGAEYYMASAEETPGSEDAIQIPPGDYELQLHELCEGDLKDPAYLETVVGKEDLAYYLSIEPDFNWGCAGLLLGTLVGYFAHWLPGFLVALAGIGWTVWKRWEQKHDSRFSDIDARIDADRSRYAFFICSLRRIEPDSGLRGGWYNLTG